MNEMNNQKNCDLTTVTTEQAALEDIGEICGGWGRWQITLTSFLFLISFPAAYYNMGMPFLAPDIDHWCKKPAEFVNISTETWKNRSIPYEIRNGVSVYSRCFMYGDYLNYTLTKERRVVVRCKFWEYDHSFYKATLTEEWNLVCDRSWLSSLCSSLYFFGYLLACFIGGQLSDRFGRKPILFACVICASLNAFVCMMSPNFWVFLIFRFFLAFGRASTFLIFYVFLMEIVGKTHRIHVALIAKFCWAFSQMALPGFVWALRNWFYTELIGTLSFIILLPLWWFMPESPRWLLSKGRVDEAEIIVANAIRTNKLVVQDLRIKLEKIRRKTIEESTTSDSKKVTFLHIMKTRNIRTLSFMLYFLWMVNMFAYYGLSFTADDIGGNMFLFYFLSACVEFPAALCLYYVQPKFGGRYTQAGFMMGCTLACLIALAVPKHLSAVMIALGIIGKFSLAGSTSSLYLISSEIYPTVVRNVGLGSCSTMGRVGAIVAPFMKEAAVSVHSLFPLALFGTLELIGTGLAFLLPETKNIHLADTLSQGEKIRSNALQIIKRRAKGKADKKGSKEFTELPPSI